MKKIFKNKKSTQSLSALKTRRNKVLKKKSRFLPTKKFFLVFDVFLFFIFHLNLGC